MRLINKMKLTLANWLGLECNVVKLKDGKKSILLNNQGMVIVSDGVTKDALPLWLVSVDLQKLLYSKL